MNRRRILKIVTAVWVSAVLMLVGVTPVSAAPPANDNFSSAMVITGLPFSQVLDNTEATFEDGESSGECAPIYQTVWYSITPDFSGVIRADTSGSGFGTTLNAERLVGVEPGFDNLVSVGCQTSGYSVDFSVQAGTTYYLQAGSLEWGGGELHVNVQAIPRPGNDDFANATAIEVLPFSDVVDNSGAISEADEPQYCESMEHTVWYSVTPASDGVIMADTFGSSFSAAGLNVYQATGSGFGGLDHLGCAMWSSSMHFGVQAGETYYVQAGGIPPMSGDLHWPTSGELHVNLQLFLPPPNDDFANATAIEVSPFSDVVDNSGANTEPDEPQNCESLEHTVWYLVTPTADGLIRADTYGSNFYWPGLNVYQATGPGFSGLSHVGCAMSGGSMDFVVQAGETYYVQAGGMWSGSGELHVNLQLFPRPPNDDFANAAMVEVWPFGSVVDNTGAATEPDEPQYCQSMEHTVWYSLTPTADGVIRADTYGSFSGFAGAGLNVYQATGPGFGGLNHVGCAMWNGSMDFSVQAGETYYVQAGGMWSGSGELHVNLQLILPPPNDDLANAALVPGLPFEDTVDTTVAGMETGELRPTCAPQIGATVWHVFTPAESGPISARASAGFDTALAAYTGSSLDALSEVGCRGWGELLTFRAEAGTTYYFQAGGLWGGRGQLQFNLDMTPPPVAGFDISPYDPSVLDTVQFWDTSGDPGNVGIAAQTWDLGDGTTATGCCPTHQYAADGDYTVTLNITTWDGRTASVSRPVQVRTHDVAIVRLSAPQAARAGQTRQIAVEVSNRRYPENVEVQLLKSTPGGYQGINTLTQFVPVRGGNRTTRFNFSYTFTSEDASLGKVTFRAVATILNARDVLPADNEAISSPTKVSGR